MQWSAPHAQVQDHHQDVSEYDIYAHNLDGQVLPQTHSEKKRLDGITFVVSSGSGLT